MILPCKANCDGTRVRRVVDVRGKQSTSEREGVTIAGSAG